MVLNSLELAEPQFSHSSSQDGCQVKENIEGLLNGANVSLIEIQKKDKVEHQHACRRQGRRRGGEGMRWRVLQKKGEKRCHLSGNK